MSELIKSVRSAKRNGGVVEVSFETVRGDSLLLQFDVRYLWAVAADLRAASIDLLAPLPESLRTPSLAIDDDPAPAESSSGDEAAAHLDEKEPRSGFVGLEQAWLLCDALNDAHIERPDSGAQEILTIVASPHFLIEEGQELEPLPDDSGYELQLRNEFKIIYRISTNDWVPDRKIQVADQEHKAD